MMKYKVLIHAKVTNVPATGFVQIPAAWQLKPSS